MTRKEGGLPAPCSASQDIRRTGGKPLAHLISHTSLFCQQLDPCTPPKTVADEVTRLTLNVRNRSADRDGSNVQKSEPLTSAYGRWARPSGSAYFAFWPIRVCAQLCTSS